jgi:putative ubiquitin-RnfH superfamily antitoxin RatB of RatAB toxin-antitoxin module
MRKSLEPAPVEVVYALADVQRIVPVPFSPGLTAGEAVRRSGLASEFPAIGRERLVLGIFGARVPAERALRPGDRVEICRPLQRDPRDRRRDHPA